MVVVGVGWGVIYSKLSAWKRLFKQTKHKVDFNYMKNGSATPFGTVDMIEIWKTLIESVIITQWAMYCIKHVTRKLSRPNHVVHDNDNAFQLKSWT